MAILLPFLKPRVAQTPKVDSADRIYAIGDIRGCFDPLVTLLSRLTADADAQTDGRCVRFVFLGNYIDHGPETARVLDLLGRMAEGSNDRVILLAGEREDRLLRFIDDPEANRDWLETGGWATMISYDIYPSGDETPAQLRDKLASAASDDLDLISGMRARYRSGDVVFCHAGADPGRPFEDQRRETLLYGHPYGQVATPLPGLKVIHGHSAALAPVLCAGRICIDTSVHETDRLTAIKLDDGETILSSRPR